MKFPESHSIPFMENIIETDWPDGEGYRLRVQDDSDQDYRKIQFLETCHDERGVETHRAQMTLTLGQYLKVRAAGDRWLQAHGIDPAQISP